MEVEIHWVAGHISVKENEKVDRAAKKATDRAGTRRWLERFASLAHVGCTISDRNWKEA